MKKQFFNRKTLKEELEKQTGYSFSYIVLYKYERKGFIKPAGFMANGARVVPVYSRKTISDFIRLIPSLDEQDIIRLRKNENTKTENNHEA